MTTEGNLKKKQQIKTLGTEKKNSIVRYGRKQKQENIASACESLTL
jgi:hypothetical protein